MTAQKDTARTAASAGNIDDTAYWSVVDSKGRSVKATLASIKTGMGVVVSMTGDVAGTVSVGVLTTTIGALKVVGSMFAAAAVTYAKIQNVSASPRLLGRSTSGAGVVEELTVSSQLLISGSVLSEAATITPQLTQAVLASDQSIASTSFADVTSMSLAVAASTNYYFAFVVPILASSSGSCYPQLSITAPASPTALDYECSWEDGYDTSHGTANDGGAAKVTMSASAPYIAVVHGVLRNGANSGSVKLRAKGATSSTWTIRAGTCGRLTVLT